MASQVFIPLTVGGGVRTVQDIRNLLNAGADKVSINTAAVFNPKFVGEAARHFGSQCIVVAIDAKKVSGPGETPRWEIFTHGGRKPTGLDAVEWAMKMEGLGAGEILLTSMDQDGMKNGFDLGVTRAISDALGIPVIASGGVGNLQHLADGVIGRPRQRGAGGEYLPLRRIHRCLRPRPIWRRAVSSFVKTLLDAMAGAGTLCACHAIPVASMFKTLLLALASSSLC